MEALPEPDVVCLHLDGVGRDSRTDPAPPEATIRGIADALDVDSRRTAYRVDLLSTLSELESTGLVDSRTGVVEGGTGERTIYWVTGRGRERAAAVRERLAGQTVVLDEASVGEVAVSELDRYFDERPVVQALSRRTGSGKVSIEDDFAGEFVDRDVELRRLEALVERTRNEGSRTVLVGGEAGIGKTTLVEHALETAREEGYAVATGTSHRSGTDPFGPLAAALRELPEGGAVAALIEDRSAGQLDDPEALAARRDALFDAVADALRERAVERPVVLFLDDLQWADPASLDLFVHLAESVTEWIHPVLFVATYRLEGAAVDDCLETAIESLVAGERDERIDLGPLPEPDSRGLVAWLTDEPGVPDEFVELVREQSGGNPLLLRETVRYLLEVGELDPTEDRYPTTADELGVATDIGTVVAGRLEPFPEPVRRVLEAASVVGDVAEPGLLAAALEEDEPTVNDRLDLLVASRLLEWRDGRIAFVGGLVREALLEALDPEYRRRLHARVGEALVERGGDAAEERYGRIAYHHERAGNDEGALSYYRKAAEQAMAIYAHDLACEHYEAALALARDRPGEREVTDLLGLGRAAYHRAEYEAAERRFEAVVERTDTAGPYMEASYYRARIRSDRGEYEAALELAQAGLDRWDGETLSQSVPRLLSRRGWALQQTGQLEAAQVAFGRELTLARELDDDVRLGRALHDVGSIELYRGDGDAVVETYEAAIDVLERTTDRRRLGRARHNLGLGYRRQGEYQQAVEALEEALAIQEDIGDEGGATTTQVNLGELAFVRGNWDQALEYYRAGRASARELDKQRIEAVVTGDIGELELARGELATAAEYLQECIEHCQRLGHDRQLASWRAHYAKLQYLRDDLEGARSQAAAALALAEELDVTRERALAQDALALVRRAEGDLEGAIEYQAAAVGEVPDLSVSFARTLLAADRTADAAEQVADILGSTDPGTEPLVWLRATAVVGACDRERGDFTRAGDRLGRALGEARALGARVEECRIRYDRGLLQRERGDREMAWVTLGDARELGGDIGAALLERRCEEALASL